MLAPLSWLKEYIQITLSLEKLADRLTEVGLGTEKITRSDSDSIFEFEITPNRPDLLSIIGIAREIAAVEEKKIKYPRSKIDLEKIKPKKILPLEVKTNYKINPRFTGIIIDNIRVQESPSWLKERLIKIGQRPINNIVDITNYVMFELGNPIHAFDYDKIAGNLMRVHQTKGGEDFKSVDGINYKLPKGAVVISDQEKIIDLCGIKGGINSGTFEGTKTIFIRVPVEIPVLIRRTSQALGLRSEASSIFERGVNSGGTIEALNRCIDLILELAGGEVSSNLYDLKQLDFKPWKLILRLTRLNEILGIIIPTKKVLEILENLNLSPRLEKKDIIETIIPTYRNDLRIEEDLIEEVARLYGYNKFPKTMPIGEIPTRIVPYFKDYQFQEKVKQILVGSGFSEVYTYSLISEKDLLDGAYNPQKSLRVDNPVSREFEYLRPTLLVNLLKALKLNLPNFNKIDFFELGKVYTGESLDKPDEFYNSARINEQNLFCEYNLAGITNHKSFFEVKGILERLFKELRVDTDPTSSIKFIENFVAFEVNFSELEKKVTRKKVYKPIPKYPPIIEDLALVIPKKVLTGNVIDEIKKVSSRVKEVSLLDRFEDTRTFHIVYQHQERNLTNEEVAKIRQKILASLKQRFHAKLKE